jgi:hypothetical protein
MPQSMGFEETETIGPDGKAHIISEVSHNGATNTQVAVGGPTLPPSCHRSLSACTLNPQP